MVERSFQDASVGAGATGAMIDAYQRACRSLHDKGQPAVVLELIAARILAAARGGERDPQKLCDAALGAMGLKSETEQGPGVAIKHSPAPE